MSTVYVPYRHRLLGVWVATLGAVGLAVVVLGKAHYEGQMYLISVALVCMVAAVVLPRAAERDGTVTPAFLWAALAAHLVGSLLRYAIIQTVYHGVADANGYWGAGKVLAPLFRTLQFPGLPHPYFGTPFIDWTTGILFAFIGPSMLGGFVVHSTLGFVGCWYFYKAFRLAFPDGDRRLFALLIFFLPTMWYWPSSLGKDSLMVLFLGLATYGFAHLFRGAFQRGAVPCLVGLAGAFMIRPPVPAALAVAAAGAFLLRPIRGRSAAASAITWMVTVPILAFVAFFAVKHTAVYLGTGSAQQAISHAQSLVAGTGLNGSNFNPPNPLTPVGLPVAVVTVNFRPFPWEAGGLLPVLTSLETVLLAGIVVRRRREIVKAFRRWRTMPMVLCAIGTVLAFSVILVTLTNFGLLARQRTQIWPYLFMLICAVARPLHISEPPRVDSRVASAV
jgi:hypothetical protein